MATPPRSCALSDASAPESLPIGVRAVETITEPGMVTPVRSAPVGYPAVRARIVVLGSAPFVQPADGGADVTGRVATARARRYGPRP